MSRYIHVYFYTYCIEFYKGNTVLPEKHAKNIHAETFKIK